MRFAFAFAVIAAVVEVGCGGTSDRADGNSSGHGDGGGGSGSAGGCLGSTTLAALGADRLVVGVTSSDPAAAAAPYDVRYIYLSGGLFAGDTPCTACDGSCSSSWWGCYNTPPGQYVTYFLQSAASASPAQVPMLTYYEILQTAQASIGGFQEGTAEVTQAATDVGIMTRYYNDWRFLLQHIGQARVMLHVEPDFWGYVRQAGDPTKLAAAVGAANPTDCGALPSTIAGMGQCMIQMVRTYAPNALVGLHASAWNVASNTDASTDVAGDAREVAAELAACGQDTGDFVVVETSDRDAGYYQTVQSRETWWDATDAQLPDYAQDLTWVTTLTDTLGVPAMFWQVPVGNAAQGNVSGHYQDNRVDYVFGGSAAAVDSGPATTVPSHWRALAAAHVLGVAFGAGAGDQTTPDTDGGHLAALTQAYVASGGQALCE
jgi:hypothetical protein|nr:hypothetical protein [Kofleriaceae bacterium]